MKHCETLKFKQEYYVIDIHVCLTVLHSYLGLEGGKNILYKVKKVTIAAALEAYVHISLQLKFFNCFIFINTKNPAGL